MSGMEQKYGPLFVNGVRYESVAPCARALGVDPSTVRRAIHDGRALEDLAGRGKAKPVTVRGVRYLSRKDCAEALGVSVALVRRAERFGYLDDIARGRRPGKWEPVICRGKTYPSQRALAEAFGLTPNSVSQHLRRCGNLDRYGLPGNGQLGNTRARAKPVMIAGHRFRSRAALARAIGRTPEWVIYRLSDAAPARSREALLAAVMAWHVAQSGGASPELLIDGHRFASCHEMARLIGVSVNWVRARVSQPEGSPGRAALIAAVRQWRDTRDSSMEREKCHARAA